MGIFKLGTMTIGSVFKKPETLKYPIEEKEPYAGQKGTIGHIENTNCNLCGICSKKCPCEAITVDRQNRVWEINHFQCIQCGYCVMSCPKKSLIMKGSRPQVEPDMKTEKISIPTEDK